MVSIPFSAVEELTSIYFTIYIWFSWEILKTQNYPFPVEGLKILRSFPWNKACPSVIKCIFLLSVDFTPGLVLAAFC